MAVTNPRPPDANGLIGRDANGYRIERLIGEGGMGAVYGGVCEIAGQTAAIKVLLAELTAHPELIARFDREAKAAARIKHPNIIPVYTAGRFPEDGRMFLVMEYVEGGSLEHLCRQTGPLPLDVAIAIILQVCAALDAVHSVAIIHRDVKTQNILIGERDGRRYWTYLSDFGIAKLLDASVNEFRTHTKAVVGTPGTMAPEQARGDKNVDARTDIYSVGCVLYRMLTGRMPYEAENSYATLEKQARQIAFPRPRELRPDIPPVIEEVILSCLQYDRDKRPGSMRTVGQRIASGIPQGEMMLRILAPRLAPDIPIGPSAPTLTGDLERSFRAIEHSPAKLRVAPLAVALVGGALLGGGGVVLSHRVSQTEKHGDELAVAAGSSATEPRHSIQAVQLSTPIDAAFETPLDAAVVTIAPDALPMPTLVADGSGSAAKHPIGVPPAGSNASPHAVHARAETQAPIATVGTLIVKVTPNADVYVDSKFVGSAPVKKLLSNGQHHVRLSGNGKEEETDVTISPTKDVVLTRNW